MSDVLSRCSDLPIEEVPAGEVIVHGGASPGDVHVLVEGTVEIRAGGRTLLTVDEPGSFLGEMSVLLGRPATASVVAVTPVRVRVLRDASSALAERPDLLLDVARLLARRVAAMTSYLVDIREQYADAGGHLAMMDVVLSALLSGDPVPADTGSDRDVPDY